MENLEESINGIAVQTQLDVQNNFYYFFILKI